MSIKFNSEALKQPKLRLLSIESSMEVFMRFILNFFFFGLLFYLIYLFFPDAFHTLVSWAHQTYEFIRQGVGRLTEGVRSTETLRALLIFPKLLIVQI